MITTNGNPDLSVILITPDSYNTIRKTIRCLRMQDVKDRLEIVIVTPSEEDLYPNLQELEDFHHYTVVEIGKINSIGSAYAAGIRQAKAHLIALAEDHSYPMPGWASALITAHQQPWAAVGSSHTECKFWKLNQLGRSFHCIRPVARTGISRNNESFAWTQQQL